MIGLKIEYLSVKDFMDFFEWFFESFMAFFGTFLNFFSKTIEKLKVLGFGLPKRL
jgi:hypothetical protein